MCKAVHYKGHMDLMKFYNWYHSVLGYSFSLPVEMLGMSVREGLAYLPLKLTGLGAPRDGV